MITITMDNGTRKFHGGVDDQIYPILIDSAINNIGNLMVVADGAELGRCNMILTHGRDGRYSLAGNLTARFIGDEARKIILNW